MATEEQHWGIRRAYGIDEAIVRALLTEAGIAPGPRLSDFLSFDRSGVVLLAGQEHQPPQALALLQWWSAPGEERVSGAYLSAFFVRESAEVNGVEALLWRQLQEECRLRGLSPPWVLQREKPVSTSISPEKPSAVPESKHNVDTLPPPDGQDPSLVVQVPVASTVPLFTGNSSLTLCAGVPLERHEGEVFPPSATLWSGALAFRTRWESDRNSLAWSVDGCIGSGEDDGDAFRFSAETRLLREVYLHRPERVPKEDPALLSLLMAARVLPGTLHLPQGIEHFVCPRVDVAVCLPSLEVLVGLYRAALEPGVLTAESLVSVAVTAHLSLLFANERYVGWRVLDPVRHLRPMGWPEIRDGVALQGEMHRRVLALVRSFLWIDPSSYPKPHEAEELETLAPMRAVRSDAMKLAEGSALSEEDPGPELARDIAAHTYWTWGFFRLTE